MDLNLAGFGSHNVSEILVLEPEEKLKLVVLHIDCTDRAEILCEGIG
jgi:hypothetical protein